MSHPWILAAHAAVYLCLAAGAAAQEARDGVADALAGHQAEMSQLGGKVDPMRRPLFFDPVDIESAPAGVPCDHLASRRPQSIAGTGAVALMRTDESSPRLVRYWRAPPLGDMAAFEQESLVFAKSRIPDASITLLRSRTFLWCR